MPEHAHLYLVSAQATPNLTPALDPAIAPRSVILLVSPDMARRADWLESVIRPRGIAVERWSIQDAWDIEHIQQRVLELLDDKAALVERGALALNATGGTKPMSIGAYEAFRAYDLPIFYIHPEHDRLIWMHPSDRGVLDIANRVRMDAFLQAHGARVESVRDDVIAPARRALTEWLVDHVRRLGKPLSILNYYASQAERTLRSAELQPYQRRDTVLGELIERFAAEGLLTRERGRLVFPDEEARFFVNGGWLEEHVYGVFCELRRQERRIQDLARSLDLYRLDARGTEVRNEIDVACLAENRLYLIECKTRRWSDRPEGGPGAEALYRLDTLVELLGGLQARAMLVSYLDLPPHVRSRADDLRIRVCAGTRLPELHAELARWLG